MGDQPHIGDLEIKWDDDESIGDYGTVSGYYICDECDGAVLYDHYKLTYVCDECGKEFLTPS